MMPTAQPPTCNMAAPLKVKKCLRMDEALPLIGEFGKYQILLDIALCIMTFPNSMLVLIPYFTQYNPPWRCSRNSTICRYNGTFGAYDKLYESRCTMPRSAWEYTKPKDYSIITEVRHHKHTTTMMLICISRPVNDVHAGTYPAQFTRSI